ncbi:hypothetical protein [Paraburkholderia bannensis]|uniref:hypothetical protein n=1 Tax=Paraburkholderia bannensis TaxID=765414 RepID=UPI002AB61E69|nr:hypothetical protein [Paraburkholderia bannensis]
MTFPEWGHSYNAIYLPLRRWGWQCALMPAAEVTADDRIDCSLSFDEREKKRERRKQQIAEDKADFQRLFRVDTVPREAATSSEFRHYTDFIRDTLRLSHWTIPIDGDGITRVLRNAVRDGRVIPVIDREWYGGQRVFKRYAPQHWPHGGGSCHVTSDGGGSAPTGRFTGPFAAAMHAADTVLNRRAGLSRMSATSRSVDWFDTVEAAAGTVSGGSAALDNDSDDSIFASFGNSDRSDASLFANAQPFEYQPDLSDGDLFDIASQKTKTPNIGDPGTWYTNPGSGQMRLYGDTGAPVIDLDFDHVHNGLRPHAHNWNADVRDGGSDVVPFSPWNP